MTCSGGCDAVLNCWFPPKLWEDNVGFEESPNTETWPMWGCPTGKRSPLEISSLCATNELIGISTITRSC